jgi:hypothetical protein
MPKYNFSWDAFSDSIVSALAVDYGYDATRHGTDSRRWLASKVARPNPAFVKLTKRTLEALWLPDYPGAKDIVSHLLEKSKGRGGRPSSQTDFVEYIQKYRNTKGIQKLLCDAMISHGNGTAFTGPSAYKFVQIEPSKQPIDLRAPHPYQKVAWEKLSAVLSASAATNSFRGLLVMPTGSGKTFTAVKWLTENVINRGQGVLWIAHRHELLRQVQEAFLSAASLANKRERLRIRIVAGEYCTATQIDPVLLSTPIGPH